MVLPLLSGFGVVSLVGFGVFVGFGVLVGFGVFVGFGVVFEVVFGVDFSVAFGVVFAVGCGVLTFLIRHFANLPEGVSFSIMIMNILVPLIERATAPRPFGEKESKNVTV